MDGKLEGKRILVVGGGTGIGLAVSRTVIRERGKVIIASRHSDQHALQNLGDDASVQLHGVDLTSEDSIVRLFETVGQFDHLVATARQTQPPQKFLESDYAAVRSAFDVKFWGQYLLAKHATRWIAPHGSITFTSGTAATRCYSGYSPVAAMNAATEALAKNLAVELAPIRVNVVSPGFVDTEPSSPGRYEFSLRLAGRIPAKRLATPQEVADAYLFLMTNTYTSGCILVVDGAAAC